MIHEILVVCEKETMYVVLKIESQIYILALTTFNMRMCKILNTILQFFSWWYMIQFSKEESCTQEHQGILQDTPYAEYKITMLMQRWYLPSKTLTYFS